mgnify:CR=1 FL=1
MPDTGLTGAGVSIASRLTKMNRRTGFTLIHLVLAIAALGILVAGVGLVTSYLNNVEKRGYDRGVLAQKAEDQKEFDRINGERTAQKAEAGRLLNKASADIIALMGERAALNHKLEKQHAESEAATAALHDKYAGLGLRFANPAAQDAGNRDGGRIPQGPSAQAPVPAAAPYIELPGPLAASLRGIVFDADKLRDDYAACYAYANEVRKPWTSTGLSPSWQFT